MDAELSGVLIQIVSAVVVFIVSVIGVFGSFYIKRIETKLKMKILNDEIKSMVSWSKDSKTFKLMPQEEQISTLIEQLKQFAMENEIIITDTKLLSMIEGAMNYPLKLEGIVLKSMALKERKDV